MLRALILGVFALSSPAVAAYIGPGLGGGALGVVLGLLGSIGLALIAIFWYPLKRVCKRLAGSRKSISVAESDEPVEPTAVRTGTELGEVAATAAQPGEPGQRGSQVERSE